jgi:uncharacterized repeat protein (TIGR03847 family)
MGASYHFDDIDAFVPGAVGVPGQRVFSVQLRAGDVIVTVRCEKQQVSALGTHLEGLLTDLAQPDDVPHPSRMALREPILHAWTLGGIAVAFDEDADRFVLRFEEVVVVDEDGDPIPDPDDPDAEQGSIRFLITRGQAVAFAHHAQYLVTSGRPSCRFCGLPIDPDGHPCPRMN